MYFVARRLIAMQQLILMGTRFLFNGNLTNEIAGLPTAV